MSEDTWWLGVDGGGTKTAFSLYADDAHGEPALIDRLALGTCHWAQVGEEGMGRVLREGAAWARGRAQAEGRSLAGAGFGICGYGEVAAADRAIEQAVKEAAGDVPSLVVNDVEEAWAAALGLADGIVIIAGTGSIAYGARGERSMRCGGWDYPLGDEGSGGWLGIELLRAFTRQADGRVPRGPLHEMVRDELGLSRDLELVGFAQEHLADRGRIAALAPLVVRAAAAGDASAQDILERAAREEADMVRTIMSGVFDDDDRHGAVPVSYVGGTFRAGEAVLGPLARALPARCELAAPLHEPEMGAVLLARRALASR